MRCYLLLLLPTLFLACRKDPELKVDIDIDIREPQVTVAADSSRDVSVTIVYTQLGNYFHSDARMIVYDMFNRTDTLAANRTQLPTAREFVRWNFKLPKKGFYMIEAGLYGDGSATAFGKGFNIP